MDDDVWKILQVRVKQANSTISELVRAAVRAIGLWKDRRDIPDGETYVRRLRKDDRLKRIREWAAS